MAGPHHCYTTARKGPAQTNLTHHTNAPSLRLSGNLPDPKASEQAPATCRPTRTSDRSPVPARTHTPSHQPRNPEPVRLRAPVNLRRPLLGAAHRACTRDEVASHIAGEANSKQGKRSYCARASRPVPPPCRRRSMQCDDVALFCSGVQSDHRREQRGGGGSVRFPPGWVWWGEVLLRCAGLWCLSHFSCQDGSAGLERTGIVRFSFLLAMNDRLRDLVRHI
jgi:hypothetical protein